MAGSKRSKIRKAFSPTKNLVESPPPPITDDNDLMDDLFAQLDSKDKTAQETSAEILKDANLDSVADNLERAKRTRKTAKPSSKLARSVLLSVSVFLTIVNFGIEQARKAAALAEQYAPTDADAEARIEREAREEEQAIMRTCEELGVKMVEVRLSGLVQSPLVLPNTSDKSRRPLSLFCCCRPTVHTRHYSTVKSNLCLDPARRGRLHSSPPR